MRGSTPSPLNFGWIKNFFVKNIHFIMGYDNLERNPKSAPKKFSRLCTFKDKQYERGVAPERDFQLRTIWEKHMEKAASTKQGVLPVMYSIERGSGMCFVRITSWFNSGWFKQKAAHWPNRYKPNCKPVDCMQLVLLCLYSIPGPIPKSFYCVPGFEPGWFRSPFLSHSIYWIKALTRLLTI